MPSCLHLHYHNIPLTSPPPPLPSSTGPNFWKFAAFPLTLYIIEKAIRIRNAGHHAELKCLEVKKLADKVTLLKFEKPAGWNYLPGQYCFVHLNALSPRVLEWHPFTISSAPHEAFLTLHVRSAGDWTSALHELADADDGIQGATNAGTVLLDGPYGSASEEVWDYEVAVLVGAGIGVTPFASILKDVRQKVNTLNKTNLSLETLRELLHAVAASSKKMKLQKLYFYWTTRNQGAFGWFGDLLTSLNPDGGHGDGKEKEADAEGAAAAAAAAAARATWEMEVTTYITGSKMDAKKDLGSAFLQLGLDLVFEQTKVGLLTGHNRGTLFERPDWGKIFKTLAGQHAGKSVGVFFCGPERLGNVLREKCQETTSGATDGTKFSFHTEVF